jgi:hypothetical protein
LAFLKRSTWFRKSSHWPGDADPLQDIAVKRRFLIPVGLIHVPLVVSSAIFLLMGPPPITIGFSPSKCLLAVTFHFAMTVREGGIIKSEEGDRGGTERIAITLREGEDRLLSSPCEHGRRVSTLFEYLSVVSTRT